MRPRIAFIGHACPRLMNTPDQPTLRSARVRRWLGHLWREWTIESWRPIAPAFTKPEPLKWNDAQVTAAWIGHATVLINFFGINILTDPVLFPRIGIRLPAFTIGPIDGKTSVITAPNTADLLRWTRLRDITELRWGEQKCLNTAAGAITISAFQVKHWGARTQRDTHRGYNGYLIESRRRGRRRILFGGDTAMTDSFAKLRRGGIDLAIMSIGAYNPWIHSHCTPEQAVAMATAAGAQFIMPVHHQTFRLSFEPLREPIERFQAALSETPERIALRDIGETFVVP